jgi:L-2,4-diaminobutyrate decarboxylase
LLRGIERADSVVWDAHKLLMMPALVTAVLFKAGDHAYDAFAQHASYLFAQSSATAPSATWWDLGQRTLECTKRMMAIELWTALRVHGTSWFGAVVDRLFELARTFADKLSAAPDFELALAPEANIVCFRYRPGGVGEDASPRPGPVLDALQRALRQRVLEDGRFYIVGTQLATGYHLRSTLMNPLATPRDLDDLLACIRELAAH